MNCYIRAAATISPQRTFGLSAFADGPMEYIGNRLSCVEPDYNSLIDAKLIRRMSRIIKMGVAAAASCLQEAGLTGPTAILTGTAYGCLEDTEIFLRKMLENKEEMLTPTAFIQSTHNTVGAQIALMLKCHEYNNTFVNRGFSFESALLDALMLIQENPDSNILVGGIDEIIPASHTILTRMALYRQMPVSNLNLFQDNLKGTMAGEGAAFFLLTGRPLAGSATQLNGIRTFYKPKSSTEIEENIFSFLEELGSDINEIDLFITGRNGDNKGDAIYHQLNQKLFDKTRTIHYKHLCGEYPTATAFALWMAAMIIQTQSIPAWVGKIRSAPIRRVLIYNHYQGLHHSLFLLSA